MNNQNENLYNGFGNNGGNFPNQQPIQNGGVQNSQPIQNGGVQNFQPIQNGGVQNSQPYPNSEISNSQINQNGMNSPIINDNTNQLNFSSYQNTGVPNPTVQKVNGGAFAKNKKIIVPIVVGIIIIVVVVLLLLGGTKTLVCTTSDSANGMDMEMKATMKFKKDNISSASLLITVDLGEHSDRKDELVEYMEEEYSSYEEDGVDVKVSSDSSKVYVEMKLKNDDFSKMGFATAKTYEEIKEEMENDGFTCK